MTDAQTPRTRRSLLTAAAAGAAGLAVARLGVPAPAEAASGAMQFGAENDAGTSETSLVSTNEFRTLDVHGTGAFAVSGSGEGAESTGVIGIGSGPGSGVRGVANTGVGVQAESTSGRALAVDGRAAFLTGGSAEVAAGAASVRVIAPWVKAGSLVVATLQDDRPGTYVRAAIVRDGRFRIYLNRRVTTSTTVAYFLFEQVVPFPD